MENVPLIDRLTRVMGWTVVFVAFAVGGLCLPHGVVSPGWSFVAAGLLVAVSFVFCRLAIRRAVAPVADLAERLRVETERLAAGEPAGEVFAEWDMPFARLAEAHNQMSRSVLQRQQNLQTQFDRLSTVLYSMDEGVIAVDKDERVLLANSASRQMIQFVAENASGLPFLEASRNWPLYESLRKCMATGRVQQREIQTTREPIRTLALRASCLPGTPIPGAVAVLHDVTELRRLENLRHEFVTNVSHELKTPLAAIMAYAETLKMGAIHDAENNLAFVTRIEEQAERLHQLIQDMLQIARVESGQEVLDIVPLSLERAVRGTVAQHDDAARRKEIELSFEIEADATIAADEDGLQTILDNLLSNALKYTPVGGWVRVRLLRAGDRAVVRVEDNGIGIAPENQPRVFERFFRADKSRSRAVISTGLGLSIVKHLAQSFGATVAVESELGVGSTFIVSFPLNNTAVATPE